LVGRPRRTWGRERIFELDAEVVLDRGNPAIDRHRVHAIDDLRDVTSVDPGDCVNGDGHEAVAGEEVADLDHVVAILRRHSLRELRERRERHAHRLRSGRGV